LDIINKDGHRFDVGPSLMLMPQFFAQTYKDLGRDINVRQTTPRNLII